MTGRLVGGTAVAAILALLLGVPQIVGIDTWKLVLGLVGLVLFLLAGLLNDRNISH